MAVPDDPTPADRSADRGTDRVDDPGGAMHVTTSVARRIRPGREHDFVTWTDAGMALVRTFPGFLGGGWLRSPKHPDEYYVVYRFADDAALAEWNESPVRKAWLARGEGVAVDYATHRLSGIEGWFEPQDNLTQAVRVVGAPPPRWKQGISIWLGLFPLMVAINYLLIPHLGPLPIAVKTLIATIVNTPLMVYVVMPFITARLAWWLTR
ncbi:MAG: antibiotic biosynthesis monooxygenase [Gordonia sp. (in: high G+C Gram-positive bacteria)]